MLLSGLGRRDGLWFDIDSRHSPGRRWTVTTALIGSTLPRDPADQRGAAAERWASKGAGMDTRFRNQDDLSRLIDSRLPEGTSLEFKKLCHSNRAENALRRSKI